MVRRLEGPWSQRELRCLTGSSQRRTASAQSRTQARRPLGGPTAPSSGAVSPSLALGFTLRPQVTLHTLLHKPIFGQRNRKVYPSAHSGDAGSMRVQGRPRDVGSSRPGFLSQRCFLEVHWSVLSDEQGSTRGTETLKPPCGDEPERHNFPSAPAAPLSCQADP